MTPSLGALGALAPVIALVALGFVLKRLGFPSAGFWPVAERLTYFVLFPALLFRSLAAAVLATAALTLALRPVLGVSGAAFTSVFQGAIRPNTYVGIAVALGVWGQTGVALTAIAIATVVPLVNLLSVAVLAHHGGTKREARGFVMAVAGNPLILACAGGGLVNIAGVSLPQTVSATLSFAGDGALLLGLTSVGAALEPRRLRAHLALLSWVSVFKLGLAPGLTAAGVIALGVPGPAWAVAVIYMALPVSASSYVLASQMGGDKALMAGIVTATTLLAGLTLTVLLAVLGGA